MTKSSSAAFVMDSEEIILNKLTSIEEEVGQVNNKLTEVATYQKVHYSKLQAHSKRHKDTEDRLHELEIKVSRSDVYVGIACFLGGAVVVGGLQFFFTQVIT